VRLFIAVQPPSVVLDEVERSVEALREQVGPRRTVNLRWATREKLHVTLRFLGEMPGEALSELTASVDAAPLAPTEAELGPAFVRLGRQVLCLPVSGLDDLAAAVVAATSALGEPPEARAYRGHLTVARVRGKGGGSIHQQLLAPAAPRRWLVDEVQVIRSHLGGAGARYEVLHVCRLSA
jgi:RNA 2',3'-cyclic 3'-phosphodiesterase